MKSPDTHRASAAAFTLVEVALAMGVASFCLVAVLGLVPIGIGSNRTASDQTACSSILTHVLADLRATPMTSPPGASAKSSEYALTIPAHSGTGSSNAPMVLPPLYFGNNAQQFSYSLTPSSSRYRLTVSFLPSNAAAVAGNADRTATGVSLLVSWPPVVDPNNSATGKPAGRVQIFASLDRN